MSWNTWSKSSSWTQHTRSWSSGTSWSTPEKQSHKSSWQSEDSAWDYQSPTGTPHVEGLPPDFKATKTHLDSREVFGKSLLRRVAPTAWSTKYGLAGKEVSTIRLVDLLWRGWQNFHIRALSHGQYVSVVVARKVSESVFASSLMSELRGRKWELDELASEYC